MPMRWARSLVVISVAFPVWAFAQAPTPMVAPPRVAFANLPQPAVPADPLELVAGNAQPVQDAVQRAAIISLLTHSRALSNVRAYPYDLKTSFTAFGSAGSDGSWQMENMSLGGGSYRWTAEGPGYSVVNLYQNTLRYSNQAGGNIPLRLAQVRAAIFYVDSVFGARASIRTAAASLNGTEVTCALAERMTAPKTTTGGRLWDEVEFCVDPRTGLLMTYSPVPGLYILYDYSNAVHFHDKTIPGKFTITEGGRTVIEAHTESVGDPKDDPSLFSPAGLSAVGAGPTEMPPMMIRSYQYNAAALSTATVQIVVLHGMATADGHFAETEVLSSSDSNLNQQALDLLTNRQRPFLNDSQQPGASPQSQEFFFTFQFVVAGS